MNMLTPMPAAQVVAEVDAMHVVAGGDHYKAAFRRAAVDRIAALKFEMRAARNAGDTAKAETYATMHQMACRSLQQTDCPGVPGWLQVERERGL
jgi:hypothetical protein